MSVQSLQMATLEKARSLMSDLQSASYEAAVKDHEELKKFVQEQVAAAKLWVLQALWV